MHDQTNEVCFRPDAVTVLPADKRRLPVRLNLMSETFKRHSRIYPKLYPVRSPVVNTCFKVFIAFN